MQNEQNHPQEHKETKKRRKKRSFLGSLFWFLMIFAITFIALNYSTFSQLASYHFLVWQGKYESATEEYMEKINKDKLARVEGGLKYINEKNVNEVASELPPFTAEIMPPDNRIVIPKIDKNVPILNVNPDLLVEKKWDELEGEIQEALKNGVVHYPHTAKPYQKGNVFLTGHSSYYPWESGNYKDVFALLTALEIDDEFIIYYDGKRYTYKITERKEVSPDEVGVLRQGNEYTATLMTCTPPGTNLRRLILVADRTKVD